MTRAVKTRGFFAGCFRQARKLKAPAKAEQPAVITKAAQTGKPKPAAAADGWTCTCGAVNKGKFCAECGKPKPAGVPQYKCDKCGWEPADPQHPPKFCPECGDPFDDGDIV